MIDFNDLICYHQVSISLLLQYQVVQYQLLLYRTDWDQCELGNRKKLGTSNLKFKTRYSVPVPVIFYPKFGTRYR